MANAWTIQQNIKFSVKDPVQSWCVIDMSIIISRMRLISYIYYFQFENLISCQPQLYFTLNKDLETDEWLLYLQINVVSSTKYWTHLKGECFRKTDNNSSQKIRGIIFCNFNNLCQPVSVHVGFIITMIRYLLSFISCNSVSKQINMKKDIFYSFFE